MSSVLACAALTCCLWALLVSYGQGQKEGPIVTTKYGDVQGRSLKQNGLPYDAFLGIPFGSSVEGDNRWSHSTHPAWWGKVHDATKFGLYCKQLITPFHKVIGINPVDSEDCLNLNIYVPGAVAEAEDLPVMVFIYGGAFLLGTTDMYPGEDLAVTGNVVVVSINYRLGTLGFLSTGDKYAEGNFGLHDQILGLKWVKENIDIFGGDNSRITIFGQSAGSASVSHLALSPLTRGLFHRVIQISGSAASYFGITEAQPATTRMTALTVACPSVNSRTMIRCLKKRMPYLLDLAGIAAPMVLGKGRVPNWIPRVDNYLVSDQPRYLITKGANKHLDMIAGHTKHDGAFIVYGNPFGLGYNDVLNFANNVKVFKLMFRWMLTPYKNPDELYSLMLKQYPLLFDDDVMIRTRTGVQIFTDFFFAGPAIFEVKHHAKKATKTRTYLYEYAYRNSFLKYEDWVQGSHIDDIYSVLGEPFMQAFRRRFLKLPYKQEDKQVKETVQKYYANFAYSGNPNQGPHEVDEFWPEYDDTERSYMEFGLNSTSKALSEERYNNHLFWTDTFFKAARPITEGDTGDTDHIETAKEVVSKFLEWWQYILQAADNEEQLLNVLEAAKQLMVEYIANYE